MDGELFIPLLLGGRVKFPSALNYAGLNRVKGKHVLELLSLWTLCCSHPSLMVTSFQEISFSVRSPRHREAVHWFDQQHALHI